MGKDETRWERIYQAQSMLWMILTAVLLIVITFLVARRENYVRYCFEIQGPTNTSFVRGFVALDISTNAIEYDFNLDNSIAPVTSVRIHGPFDYSVSSFTSPLATALCGAAGAVSCDTTSLGVGRVRGSNTMLYNGVSSVPQDVRPLINTIRENPVLFELQIGVEGAITYSASFTTYCGYG